MKIVVVSYCADQGQTFYDVIPVPDSVLASVPFDKRYDAAVAEANERVDRLRGDYSQIIDTMGADRLLRMAELIAREDEAETETAFAALEDDARD